jgi:hypothetical protein
MTRKETASDVIALKPRQKRTLDTIAAEQFGSDAVPYWVVVEELLDGYDGDGSDE